MLDEFLISQRSAIIARTQQRVAARRNPKPSEVELRSGIPIFLDQLVDALRIAKSSDMIDHKAIDASAARRGQELLALGLTIGQVVHDYGDICQAVTALALESNQPISGAEFRTLNLCLDDAIAGAVTEYSRQRERTINASENERLGFLAHELRNLLAAAMLSFESIKRGHAPIGGSTALLHSRTLLRLRDLIDRSLAEVRLDAGIHRLERISVAALLEDVEISADAEALTRSVELTVKPVDRKMMIDADSQLLAAALTNLLQNAFKFTPKGGHVTLTTQATDDRVLFEIADECGGLPPGDPADLFRAFSQRSTNRSGLGLGLSICAKAAKANGGEIRVRDVPGKGCVFTIDLPRQASAT